MKKSLIALGLLLALLLCGCQPIVTGTDTVIIEPEATPWRDPSFTPAPRVTASPGITADPAADPEGTPNPTASPVPYDPEDQPPLLAQAMAEQDVDFSELTGTQLVLIYHREQGTQAYCYERSGNSWELNREISYLRAYVSKNGINPDKKEGDGSTPSGLYPLVFAFGHRASADTRMEYRQITEGTYWVDDPDSPLYNQWTQQCDQGLWEDADRLWEAGVRYNLAIVVGYNYGADIVRGKGSAIFVHCGDAPTNGGVCMKEANLKKILSWLDAAASPQILIAGES